MKIQSPLCLVAIIVHSNASAAVVFSQDFSAGGTTSSYVNATTPTEGQWNAISSTGASKVWSIASGGLELSSSGANSAFVSRTTDFSTVPLVAVVSFDLKLISSSTALTSAVVLYFGTGFDDNNSGPSNSAVHSRFALNFTSANGFSVRDINASTNGASTFTTGSYQITLVANNSGSSYSYSAPDGTTETVANDTWDLWVGNSKQLNDKNATTASAAITDFKFGAVGNGTYSFGIDNISVSAVPEPAAALLGSLGVLGLLRRRRVA